MIWFYKYAGKFTLESCITSEISKNNYAEESICHIIPIIIQLHMTCVYISNPCNSTLFWNYTWQSVQWRALCTKITEVNLSGFVYRLFHEDFSPIIRTNTCFQHI